MDQHGKKVLANKYKNNDIFNQNSTSVTSVPIKPI